ncbi:hypothetical protein GOBAR_AA37244 [Gossypium barbadense]|uniref:Uncharacterized protein n=1 Tax=Gossypium barbadense TaxID=3634 RepID=A0A2P5VXD7_GOSBA|nr:hypothetical protein GOBAR_AA37244 [Gossypium barbadense]
MIKLQAPDSANISSNQDDCLSSVNSSNVKVQTSLQESPRKNMIEPHSNPCNKNRVTYEERRLPIDELDEWRTHVKEKPKAHDESKRHHDKCKDETKQFKVRDKVLLDEKDPRIATPKLNTNEDNMIKLQAPDSANISSNQDDCLSSVNSSNVKVQTSLQESPRKNMIEPHSNPCNKNRVTYEERRLPIDELDEWRTHVKEKPKAHDESKRHHDKCKDETKQFKVRDKVLLDEKDPRIATPKLNTNE